jgi:pimeloyl-ACP methyl ester carboxylesterase
MVRQSRPADILTVYIEGDGAPWPTPWQVPRDPTPMRPVSMALAAGDAAPAVAYLGRPCQYLDADSLAACDSDYWSGRRYGLEVVVAIDQAITQLKDSSGARRIVLVGHSGGGVVAALLAGRRGDVDRLITVAAPLALGAWAAWHRISAFEGSLDPFEATGALPPAVHFVGAGDRTVPPDIVMEYVQARGGRLETVAGFDHECCWARDWPVLLSRAWAKENAK